MLMLRYEGYKVEEIAKMYGTRTEWISQVCRKYREQGLEEFIRNKYKTHHRALTDTEEDAILAPFEKAAEAGQVVTVKEIKAAFDKVRGKDTGRGYIYMLLKRHGWRKVMPRSKHPKAANEEACDASKKLTNLCWKCEKSASRTQASD
jgi:transposase